MVDGLPSERHVDAPRDDPVIVQKGKRGENAQVGGDRSTRPGVPLPPGPVVVLGSDTPTVTPVDVAAAFRALGPNRAVFGPAPDGGYWLIGLHQSQPSLLAGIPWGSDQVMGCTLERAVGLGLDVGLLATRRDLDWPRDLLPWR